MDELDYQILNLLQNEFPLSERPYEVISDKLEIPCEQLLNKLQLLIAEGITRRMGASLDSRKFGYNSTLAAISVDDSIVGRASEIIDAYPEITHSYLRNDQFNIWFTVIASDNKRIEKIIEEIRLELSLKNSQILNLPAKRLFKLNACFDISS